jgi:intracellular sulfur oxidation DsrE/DsrF family protein
MVMSNRRTFLAVTSAAVASTAPASAAPRGPYDFAGVDARLHRAARHRQVFAAASVSGGVAIALMNHGIDAYERTMGEGPGSLHAAAVFYARGVILGVDDAMWHAYRLADAAMRRGDSLGAHSGPHNPFASDLAALTARGATLLVCDRALADWSTYLVSMGGFSSTSPEDVHAQFRAHLLPGALLVPAGVAALNAAQEARFTYVQASL